MKPIVKRPVRDCHTDHAYNQPPTCLECHDEERDPREFPPGDWLN